MSEPPSRVPLEWVAKRDGRLVPFEIEKIGSSLFAAAESLGKADAFLVRELTDSVVHFLSTNVDDPVPTTAQVAEVVVKVVRELGHPALALAYASHRAEAGSETRETARSHTEGLSPSARSDEVVLRIDRGLPFGQALRECARQYALHTVFGRDVLALHADGLLALFGLERPDEMAASLLELRRGADREEGLFALLEEARKRGSGIAVLDGPEHLLAPAWPAAKPFAPGFARRLDRALRLADMRAVVNLNAVVPPAWADEATGGPLFPSARAQVAGLRDDQADHLAREWSGLADSRVRIDWHLTGTDLIAGTPAHERLLGRAQEALRGANVAFAFDRHEGEVALGEGMIRGRPALLGQVGLNLPRLAEWTGTESVPDRFLEKLRSLTRLALGVGAQKREYLRGLARAAGPSAGPAAELTRGFILDRAALVLVPIGLDHLVRTVTGHSMTHGAASLEFARRVVQHLRDVLRENSSARYPLACIDGTIADSAVESCDAPAQVGLTPWDPGAAVPNQLRAAGVLHATAEAGTVLISLEPKSQAADLIETLRLAWERSAVVRLRFVRLPAAQPALPFRD